MARRNSPWLRLRQALEAPAMRLGLAYVTEDRRQLGLSMPMSITTNISLPMLHEYVTGFLRATSALARQIERDYRFVE